MKRTVIIYATLLGAVLPVFGQSLSLSECMTLARENDPSVKAASIDVDSANELRKEVMWNYFPTVKASAVSFHAAKPFVSIGVIDILGTSDAAWDIKNIVDEYASGTGIKTRYETLKYGYGATLVATQPIFAGGRIVNGNALARLGVEAAGLQKEVKLRESDATIEQKYWTVVSLQQKRKTLDQALETLGALRKDLLAAVEAGLVAQSELSELDVRISTLKSTRVKLKSGMTLAKMDLLNLIGYDYSVLRLDGLEFSDCPDGIGEPASYFVPEEQLSQRMQERQLLDLQVKAKTLEKKMAVGENLPTLGLGAAASYGKMVGDPTANGAVFVTLSVPITDWGKNSHKIRRSENEIRKAEDSRDYLQAQLLLKARSLWVEMESAWEQKQVSEEAVAVAKDACVRTEAEYKAGSATMGDLLRAELSLQQAQDALIDSQIAYRTAVDEYLRY